MTRQSIRVAIVGGGSIAKAHAVGLRSLASFFGREGIGAEPHAIVDADPEAAQATAAALSVASSTSDLGSVLADDRIDAITVATPNDTHGPIAIQAMEAGKAVLCEKPMAHSVASAEEMTAAATRTRAINMVNFNYRKLTAIQYLKRLIDDGELGDITAFRGRFLQDWGLDPAIPRSWKFESARAGGGAILGVGCHVIDLAHLLVGDITDVAATTRIRRPERPVMSGRNTYSAVDPSGEMAEVDTDDIASALVRFGGGSDAIGTLSTSRTSPGYKNHCIIEVEGTVGTAMFDYERMNEIQVCSPRISPHGFSRIVMGPQHDRGVFWASSGLGTGFAETMALQMRDLVTGTLDGEPAADTPTFEDGLRAQRVAETAIRSAASGAWEHVPGTERVGQSQQP